MTWNLRPHVALLATTLLWGCASGPTHVTPPAPTPPPAPEASRAPTVQRNLGPWTEPEIVAESQRRWTGVAVALDGRLIVNYPRWSDDVPTSVAVLGPDGTPTPFPDAAWNGWEPGDDPGARWVCVQSVVVDAQGRLWVLDPGNPKFAGVVEGAPKLVRFDSIEPGAEPQQVIRFAAPTITARSYLNDVRFDLDRGRAYLTDSGDGALIVVDLRTGESRRVLDGHESTEADPITLTIGGKPFDRSVHADGIAVDLLAGWVYYQPLTSRTLYRVRLSALANPSLSDAALGAQVEEVGETGASDGLLFHHGAVWLTSLELDAIRTIGGPMQAPLVVARDPRIAWPDSFAKGPDGSIYFTTAQIHLGDAVTEPFRIWRVSPTR